MLRKVFSRLRRKPHCVRTALSRTDGGYRWGRICWDCHAWIVKPTYESKADVPETTCGVSHVG